MLVTHCCRREHSLVAIDTILVHIICVPGLEDRFQCDLLQRIRIVSIIMPHTIVYDQC